MNSRRQPLAWHFHGPQGRCPYHPWLIDQGSLTRRIQERCSEFSVRALSQGHGRPGLDEADLLGLRPREDALLREVFLCCGERPVVFAHSVLPFSSLQGPWRDLARLGNRSLGATLFADPRVRRAPLQYKRLNIRHALFRRACTGMDSAPAHLWARRSVFRLDGRPILVTEVFLPAILELPG